MQQKIEISEKIALTVQETADLLSRQFTSS